MNINAVSAGIQHSKAYNTASFKGTHKVFTQLAGAGSAAQQTAHKTGRIGQFFSKVSNTLKEFGTKALLVTTDICSKVVFNAIKAASFVKDTVKSAGNKVSKGVSNFFNNLKKDKKNSINTVIQVGNNKTLHIQGKNHLSILATNDNIIINGKAYKYDGKLPDGVEILPGGGFSIKGKGKISDYKNKIKEFAKTVEENGTPVGTKS